jgi:transposase-like protein
LAGEFQALDWNHISAFSEVFGPHPMRYPQMEPTPEQRREVERLSRERTPQNEIAKKLGIARSTLRRHFAEELRICERTVGRPAWNPSDEERMDVTILAAAGFKQESIARRYGVSDDTLRFYCGEELENGYDLRKQDAVLAIYRKGIGEEPAANVAGLKEFLKRLDVLPQPSTAPARKAPAPGKKEQALADAAGGAQGTTWDRLLKHPGERPN